MTAVIPASRGLRRQVLGSELKRLREICGLRLEDAAAHLSVAASTLSRIETGQAQTRTAYLAALLDLYGVDDPDRRSELTGLAREGQRAAWWADSRDLLPAGARRYLDLESAASGVRCYAAQAVPGLLRAPGYADAALRAAWPGRTAGQVRALAGLHERRRDLLRAAGARVHVVMDESALLRPVGGPEVMAAQMKGLLAAAADPAVTLQVARLSAAELALSQSFTMLSFAGPGEPDMACTPGPGGRVTFCKIRIDTSVFRNVFAAVSRAALPPAETARLIGKALERWDQR